MISATRSGLFQSCDEGKVRRGQRGKINGILNGIDYDVFNPKTDKNLVKNYDIKNLKNKEANKKAILKEFGLEYKDL